MNRLNAKRIGVLAASLLFGLAVAGQVTYSSIPIISSAGQPVVQIVVGSTAQPSDGVVAANIAAAIGSLSFTSTPVTATVSGKGALSCVVTTATCAVSNQQVWLGVSGTATPSGSYGFTALIGSVLNQGDINGSPQSTKGLQTGSTNYAFAQGSSTTASPLNSPYTGVSVPTGSSSPSASSNGGGVSFSTFSSSSYDNIFQVSSTQLPSLMSNSGAYGESEYLWLTGFPVYDQQTNPNVQNFALMSAGGAYQVLFTNPVHEPRYTTGNSVNNAAIKLLGQSWTIISYTLPSGTVTTSTMVHGGKLGLAASLVPLTTVYVGKNVSSGPFTVQVSDLGTASSGISPAALSVFYNGVLTNSSSVWPGNTVKFNVTGNQLYVKVNQTFAGLYAYQKWAKLQLYSGVYNVTDGQTFNQTRDPGWNMLLYWTNTTGGTTGTDLKSIVIYNVSPTMLTPGQSFTFIQNPKVYKVTFAGDTLGNDFDAMTVQTQYAGSVAYANKGTNPNIYGLGSITNVTEPAQELIVTSQIPNAFSFAGQTSGSLTYVLTPYELSLVANSIGADTPGGGVYGTPVNVEVSAASPVGNYITSGHQLGVTISGYAAPGGASTQSTVYFSSTGTTDINDANAQTTSGNFFNITAVTLNRAIPGVTVTVGPSVAIGGAGTGMAHNDMAYLQTETTPEIIYSSSSHSGYDSEYLGTTGVTYNQQNGQPTTTFKIGSYSAASKSGTALWSAFTYNIVEEPVSSNTAAMDYFGFDLVNSTVGLGAVNMFYLNYSLSNQQNNVTYISSTGIGVPAQVGFLSEKGSKVASISSTTLAFNLAKNVDTLQMIVGPVNTTVTTSKNKVGPYGVGQTTNIPNVTIAQVNQTCTVTGAGSGCTVSGSANLTATPSVTSATTPVKLDTSATPLVVLDSNANAASTLIVVGSKYVNSVAAQIFSQNPSLNSGFNTGSVVVQAFGSNRVLVAGYYANQTVQAGNQFIQALLSATS